MCQIFAGKSNKIRATLLNTPDLLEDLYTSNSDGLGAMYATAKGKLRTPKQVPKNFAQCTAFIRQLPDDDRNLVLHFRMRTSGNIDPSNAHPFDVLPGGMAMTHNGILSISTKADESKCDTRHYIENILRPQLQLAAGLAYVEAWLDLVGEDIGSNNRFVFMDHRGEMSFVNRHTGIEHDGMWIANTYSFDAALLIPGYRKATKLSTYKGFDDYDDYGSVWRGHTTYNNPNIHAKTLVDSAGVEANGDFILGDDENFSSDDVWAALGVAEPEELSDLLQWRPNFTLRTIMDECEFIVTPDRELNNSDDRIAKLLVDGNTIELARLCISSAWQADQIAEIMCWYGSWSGKAINADEAEVLAAEVQDELNQELLALTAGTATAGDYAG